MPAKVIKANVQDGIGTDKVTEALRSLLQYRSISIIDALNHAAVTDNSTGTANSATAFAIPIVSANTAGSNNAQHSGANTAYGVVHNCCAVLMDSLDDLCDALGIPGTRAEGNGTIATPDTVPAVTKTVTGVAIGSTAAKFSTHYAVMVQIAKNIGTLVEVANRLSNAVGVTPLDFDSGNFGGADFAATSIVNLPTATACAADGTDSISKAVMDAFLTNCANWIAKIAAQFTAINGVSATGVPTYVAG